VAETPDQTWLVFDGRDRLTFAEAAAASAAVAGALRASGCKPGARVALLMENRIEFITSLLGVLSAGCIAVPMHARARGTLLSAVLGDAEPEVLIAGGDQLAALAELDVLPGVQFVVTPDETEIEAVASVPVTSLTAWVSSPKVRPYLGAAALPTSSTPAIIQYTSGTTGVPKGAVCSHHFVYMYSALSADAHGWQPRDVLMTPLPLYHSAALHHVALAALHTGATGHLKSRFSASRFWEQARDDGANFVVLMGPLAVMLMARAERAVAHRVDRVFCTPPPPDVQGFEERFGVRLLWQTYGMTEIYPIPMQGRVSDDDRRDAVGRPSQWTDFGVADDDGELLGPGELGELIFRPRLPRMMADGYFRRAEETAEAFRGLVFHTGDMGYYDDDGVVYLVGRAADRIRRLGENIPAGEVERVVLEHEGVYAAAVYGVPSALGEDEIKVDVVGDVDLHALHDHLDSRLPRFMVPRYYELRGSFPTTPTERVRKNELRALGIDRGEVLDMAAQRERGERTS
jgi:crotonobetaine/carnitine-CoA ligase